MAVQVPQQEYKGSVRPITIGSRDTAFTIGGDTAYPFYNTRPEMALTLVHELGALSEYNLTDAENTRRENAARALIKDIQNPQELKITASEAILRVRGPRRAPCR